MRKIVVFSMFLLCFACISVQSQSNTYVFQKELSQKGKLLKADVLGNVYLSDGSVIYKYDNQLNFQYSFADFSLGKIHSFDVSNPMKIMVFFGELMQLSFLNNTLSIQNTLFLLRDLQFVQPTQVCLSYDNGFWVYDEMKDRLVRYDANTIKVNESQILTNVIGEKIYPNSMQEVGGLYLILNSPKIGFIIFDKYGTYLKRIPITDVSYFNVWNGQLVFVKNNSIQVLNIETVDIQSYILPDADAEQVIINGKQLIILTAKGMVKMYFIPN
ncbi:MAG: hypothetical protein KBA86_02655 [Bacteroidales bacterium]|nr:hypothetical protein [Bacteroidales bacterium]